MCHHTYESIRFMRIIQALCCPQEHPKAHTKKKQVIKTHKAMINPEGMEEIIKERNVIVHIYKH